jgi:hypothetical protein
MTDLLAHLNRLYAAMLNLYPRRFRVEFGGEMQAVFQQLSTQAAEAGFGRLAATFLREMKALPLAAMRAHWYERKEVSLMEAFKNRNIETPAPGWATAAVIGLFVVPGLLGAFRVVEISPISEQVTRFLLISLMLLLFGLPLGSASSSKCRAGRWCIGGLLWVSSASTAHL